MTNLDAFYPLPVAVVTRTHNGTLAVVHGLADMVDTSAEREDPRETTVQWRGTFTITRLPAEWSGVELHDSGDRQAFHLAPARAEESS